MKSDAITAPAGHIRPIAYNLTYQSAVSALVALLRDKPEGTGLRHGAEGEFFMSGGYLMACMLEADRAEEQFEVTADVWDAERGAWEGTTAADLRATINSPEFLPDRSADAAWAAHALEFFSPARAQTGGAA